MTDTTSQLDLRIATGVDEAAPIGALAPVGQLAVEQRHEVTFIEGNVGDLQTLVSGLAGQEIHVLDAGQDGLSQMAQILAGRTGIDAINVIAHGATAAVNFGGATLNSATLGAHQADLAAIGASLSPGGDLMLYACDTGAGAVGQAFIDRLAASTGADVAASNNLTGSADLGGDWKLEVTSGHIETQAVVDPALAAAYHDVLGIANSDLNFNIFSNFAVPGDGSGSASDAIYKVNGDSAYQFKIDGATRGVAGVNVLSYVASDHTDAGESQITFSFQTGQVFTPVAVNAATYASDHPAQDLVFKGYDSQGALVATNTASIVSDDVNGAWSTISFSGMTNIATLKMTATSNGGLAYYLGFYDFALADIHPPPSTVTDVSSTTPDGPYKAGDTIDISVTFDAAVHVTGAPQITLANGGSGGTATYASGDATDTLHFSYVVQAGDTSADLDFASTTALSLNGGTITLVSGGADAILTLPSPGTDGSLGANKDIVVDTTAPTVTITSDHASLSLNQTPTATITFTFSEDPGSSFDANDVTVTGGVLGTITGSGAVRTAIFTPTTDVNAGTASITVAAGAYTDVAGNDGGAGTSPALTYDTLAPSVTVTNDATGTLHAGQTADITFTFTEDPGSSFDTSGIEVTGGGTLSAATGAGLVRHAIYTPPAGVDSGQSSIEVFGINYFDAAGNLGAAGLMAGSIAFDTLAPAAPSAPVLTSDTGVSSSDNITKATALTFTGTADAGAPVTIYDGTTSLGGATADSKGNWTVNTTGFTAGDHTVTAKQADAAGNLSDAGPGLVVHVDTTAPTITSITSDHATLNNRQTTAIITFSFSEDPGAGFVWNGTSGDVVVTGGTLGAISGTGTTRTATFTPTTGVNAGTASITVAAGAYTDVAGNDGGAGTSPTLTYDTLAPRLTITSDATGTLHAGQTTDITFTFSEDPGSSFDTSGMDLNGGTLSAVIGSGLVRHATYTPPTGVDSGSIFLTLSGPHYTDTAGNPGASATMLQPIVYDTLAPDAPSVPVLTSDTGVSNSDNITKATALTFTGTADANALVTIYDGSTSLGGATADSKGNWTVNTTGFTAGDHTVTAKQADAAGNLSDAGPGLVVHVDTTAPTVTITSDATGTLLANDTATITFSFSEDPGSTFNASDITTTGGTLTSLSTSGATRTAIFSPTPFANGGTASITVAAGSYTDKAGNDGGAGTTPALTFDTQPPSLAITSDHATLHGGQTATITFTFSEDPGSSFIWDGSAGDVTVTGGTLGALSGTGAVRTAIFTPTAGVNAGAASIAVAALSYTDAAGNHGQTVTPQSLTYDTLAPDAPSAPALASGSDTGVSSSDGITQDTSPSFTGTAEVGSTVTLFDGATDVQSVTADSSGIWTIGTSNLTPGAHTITVRATDAAGNVSATSSSSVRVDTTAPTVAITSDHASLHAGETAIITFTFNENTGSSFVWDGKAGDVTVTGGTLGAISGSGATWHATFTPTDGVDTGTAAITVAAGSYIDIAGNAGEAGTTPALTYDTLAPDAPSTPVLAAGSDTGLANDDTTNSTSPSFTGTAEANAAITLYDTKGVMVGTGAADAQGNWTATTKGLSEGDHTLTATATDAAGNISSASSGLVVHVDTTAPTVAITSDHATLHGGQTADITFSFSEDPGSSFDASDITVTGGTLGAITGSGATLHAIFTPTPNTDAGAASITVAAGAYTDTAGNDGGAGTTPSLTYDTLAPGAPSAPALSADTGVAGDGITSTAVQSFTGTAEANAVVTLYDGANVLGSNTADSSGNWSITTTLTEGDHSLTTKQVDVAGNVSLASASLAVTIDTTAPTLAITSDHASLHAGETAIITFTFSEDPGASFDAGSITVTGGTLGTLSGSGTTWHATFTPTDGVDATAASITVAAGGYADTAGNDGGAGTTPSLHFDTLVPNAPSTPAMTSGTDTGSSSSDAITSNIRPTFTGTAEAGAQIALYDTDGETQLGGTTADGSGNWSVTPISPLDTGPHTITVTQTDAAGNVSVASSGLTVTIDTTAPTVTAPDLASASDSGSSNSDDITNVTTPTLSGMTEANASVTLYDTDGTTVLGTATANDVGLWSIESATLGAGPHTLTVKATDTAGNVSDASAGLSLTVDTAVPTAPGAPSLSPTSDTGNLGDNHTETSRPVITGTGVTGDLVTLFDGSTQVGSATVDSSGAWSITSDNLTVGDHTLTATQTSVAGNVSLAGPSLALVIDSPPDTTPPATVVTPAASAAIGIDLTSEKAQTETVTLPNGQVIDNPTFVTAQQVAAIQADLAAGHITAGDAKEAIIHLALPTTGVAIEAYSFFTGSPPSAAGLTYLINSDANPNDLTDPYYAAFNTANRYINFAVNLGAVGEGKASFEAGYGALSFEQAVAKAYDAIIGAQVAQNAGFDPAAGEAYITAQEAYFHALGGTDTGAKAAMVGYILSVAADSHLGGFYQAAHDQIASQVGLVGGL